MQSNHRRQGDQSGRRSPASRKGRLGLLLAAALGLQCHDGQTKVTATGPDDVRPSHKTVAITKPAPPQPPPPLSHGTSGSNALVELAKADPAAFVHYCRREYDRRGIQDYVCRFTKQELVDNVLGKVEEAAVRFREEPYSVDMQWLRNAPTVNRALYVKNAWIDRHGRELAWFKPHGALIKLFVPKIKQPIDGERARKAARRRLDQFGFKNTLDLIIKYIERAQTRSELLALEFVGNATIDGRPTWVFERHLPFTGKEEPYPDALLRYHIDQEWLVPTACFSFGDHQGRQLLGSYVITDVRFNVGLDHDDFDPKALGF